MLTELKKRVCDANIKLVENGLVSYTWGNVSARDHDTGYIVIKPSGVPYSEMSYEDMVVVDINGKIIEGHYKPSSDTPTHLYLYSQYYDIRSIVHTHSKYATAFAQAKRHIPAFGTTHADYFFGHIPCSRDLSKSEVENNYEINTGKVLSELINSIRPFAIPAALVASHGPFAWGQTPESAVYNATVLEKVAEMAFISLSINPLIETIDQAILDKHYYRKHGKNAYYGQ